MKKTNIETLEHAVEAMRVKIEQHIPEFLEEPLSQSVRVNTGELVMRVNPSVQEFRAIVRDYATTLNTLKAIIDDQQVPAEIRSLETIRSKFKVAK